MGWHKNKYKGHAWHKNICYSSTALLPGALASLLLGNPKLDCEGGRGQSDKEGDSDKKSCDLMIVKILISDHRIVMWQQWSWSWYPDKRGDCHKPRGDVEQEQKKKHKDGKPQVTIIMMIMIMIITIVIMLIIVVYSSKHLKGRSRLPAWKSVIPKFNGELLQKAIVLYTLQHL